MKDGVLASLLTLLSLPAMAAQISPVALDSLTFTLLGATALLVCFVLWVVLKVRAVLAKRGPAKPPRPLHIRQLEAAEIDLLLQARRARKSKNRSSIAFVAMIVALLIPEAVNAQSSDTPLFEQPGIIITIVLLIIPLLLAVVFLVSRVRRIVRGYNQRQREEEAQRLADYLLSMEGDDVELSLLRRKESLETRLAGTELSGVKPPDDPRGLVRAAEPHANLQFVAMKKKAVKRPNIDPALSRLIVWYLGCAIFWLVFGTSVGEYLGIKFVAPDVDHQSWLSFGRLRPVHTNAVFWGWSSLGMIGLGYYIVSIVSNTPIASIRRGWIGLALINAAVLTGTISLMAGINNGGGEYREYVWPIMALFGAGLIITLVNFIQTIAARKTREIYISNWYIVSAIIFTLVITFIAYWPTWQNGLGETIVQGYYMHQGVGMWFMLFTLGIVYYFLPQQLNKPIYSYSLGILAFWTQILFYTVIGTHHFVFSSIPWSLQTVAIVGSMGMVIPVVAGTTNFLMTFKGDFGRVNTSYTLPFFLVGIVFYFTGSFQGTAEAFRYTNLLWHFTDFTVAHSHMTMYGIIAFLLWGSIYALVPRLTGREPSQLMVGVHFWLAFIGLLLYSVPLMIGGTLRGLMWMEGAPFMDTVTMMGPYWLWRAIGGSMMWLAHLIFAFNFYRMVTPQSERDIREIAFEKIATIASANDKIEILN